AGKSHTPHRPRATSRKDEVEELKSAVKTGYRWVWLGAGLLGCGLVIAWLRNDGRPVRGADPPPDQTKKSPTPEQQAALEEGQALFRGLCSGCHGGAGRGGKGPDLTRGRFMHGNKDEDIARVIREGVPKTTMKKLGESLKEEQIAKLVLFIRSLARAPREATWKPYLKGDPAAGRKLFFDEKGQANCVKCHSVDRQGGRVGPPLDRIASRRSAEFVMESILEPSKDIDPDYESVQVVTKKGIVIVGLRVNESNFSIQVREETGKFHSFLKSELEEVNVLK